MGLVTRRELGFDFLKTLLIASLGQRIWQRNAVAGPLAEGLSTRLRRLHVLCSELRFAHVAPAAAQRAVADILSDFDLPELLQGINLDKLVSGIDLPSRGELTLPIPVLNELELPQELSFKCELVALSRGRSIPPHGHNNQLTAFLTLGGELLGRHYDRDDEGADVLLTPTLEGGFLPGLVSTISDEKDNVHWFTALSDRAFLFNLVVTPLATRPDIKGAGRVHLDLRGGAQPDGRIRARRVKGKTCYEIYG